MYSELCSITPFSQWWEKFGFFLPRSLLDHWETTCQPEPVAEAFWNDVRNFWSGRKVALVRQTSCLSGYSAGDYQGWAARVLSATYHLGPFAFLSDLGADFFVVRMEKDPETNLWWEKHAGDVDTKATRINMDSWIRSQEELPGVVNCRDIQWDKYDLVVCFDVPVPTRITKQTSRTLWAYYSVEAGGALHENSLRRPIPGYHLYLNHCFRRYRARPRNRKHVLEFPFTFQSAAGWKNLLHHVGKENAVRAGAVVDKFSWLNVPTEINRETSFTRLGEDGVYWPAKRCVELLATRRFAIRTEPRKRWGNWSVEAVQAGCLFLGWPASMDMKGALLPELEVKNLAEARRKMDELLETPRKLVALQRLQGAMVEHLAFRRPLADLTRRAQGFFSR